VALADLIMAVFEGALVLSRAARSSEPFWNTIETLITTAGCLIAEPSHETSEGHPRRARRGG
jgi:hypothetical protein